MYPPAIEDAHASAAERQTFELLAQSLPDEYFCYHSKPLLSATRAGLREGEIDFVLLHPALGLLALEVKGGGLTRDGQGRWYHLRADGSREPLRQDPFAQARRNLHALCAQLCARLPPVLPEWRGELRLPHGHAVLLPDVPDARRLVPGGMAPELLLDAAALAAPEPSLRAAMQAWAGARPPLPPREFKRFRKDVFHPALQLVPTLAARLQQESAQLCRLTTEQTRLLDATELVQSARVEGPAGSGKTVLALEKARRLAATGKRVALICYNRPLADALAAQVAADSDSDPAASRLHVSTYHALCHRAAEQLGRPFAVPAAPAAQQDFWSEQAPELLLEAADQGQLTFDALVVDEAQDLLTEWWVPLAALIPASAPLWIFYDPDQDIYNRAGAMPGGLCPLQLTTNCRATRRLRELCDQLSGRQTASLPGAPEGVPHEELAYRDAVDLQQKLASKVSELCRQGLHPAQLVILAPHRQQHSSLAGLEELAGYPIIAMEDWGRVRDGILFSTARRFKGLEADVVLLIDQDAGDPACSRVHRYVACSRARGMVVVFSRASRSS